MIGRTNTGSGGSGGLNFTVVGGTTAPKNPKENMIWVNTSTAITDWIFSGTQPTAASGRVWISTGTSSAVEFNALKKNGIQVYPISVKQYVSGKWVDKTAKTYQGGEWVDWWNGELYDSGNEYTSHTGGWYLSGDAGASFHKGANSMTLSSTGTGLPSAVTTTKDVDFTGYKKVYVNVSNFTVNNANSNVGIAFTSKKVFNYNEIISFVENEGSISTDKTIELDIPNVATKYLHINVYYGSATIKKIWME